MSSSQSGDQDGLEDQATTVFHSTGEESHQSNDEINEVISRSLIRNEALEYLLTQPYSLTSNQSLAVLAQHDDRRPILVRAGPGSGKTTVIVRRYIFCLLRGANVNDLLCVTFTRRAAREIKQRIVNQLTSLRSLNTSKQRRIEDKLKQLRDGRDWISTFHSAASRLLTSRIGEDNTPIIRRISTNYRTSFDFLGGKDRQRLIEELLEENGWQHSTTPRGVEERINHWRVNLIPPNEAISRADSDVEFISARLYERLREHKQSNGMMDYMDLIYYTGQLMRRSCEIRDKIASHFDYVLVDEFQDTNPAQQMMISNIVKQGGRLFAVGDEKQAIYGWRGANPDMMRNFRQSFPGSRLVSLDVNFRSRALITLTTNVLAERCGDKNGGTMDPPTSDKGLDYGDPPGLFQAESGEEEAEFVRHYVKKMNGTPRFDYSDIAVLVRLNKQKSRFREVFKNHSIPVNELGAGQFFNRPTTRIFLACLRCLKHIYQMQHKPANSSPTGVPPCWYDWALSELGPLKSSHETLLESLDFPGDLDQLTTKDSIPPDVGSRFSRSFKQSVETFRNLALKLHRGHYLPDHLDTLKRECFSPGNRTTGEHLRECASWAKQNVRYDGFRGLVNLLNRSKFQEYDPQLTVQDNSDGVVLSTVHGAKGMEFPIVIIPGLEEGWFPHTEGTTDCELPEEMRLLYVGMTRAIEDLVLCYARSRTIGDNVKPRKPSRFVDLIPEEYLEVRERRRTWSDWLQSFIESFSPVNSWTQ